MANEENGDGHFDLLTAALSESGLGDLVGFGESEEPKEQPPIQVVTEALPVAQSTPVRPAPSQFITVRTGPRGQSPAQIISALPISQTPVKVISSGDPQAAKTRVTTKIIRLATGSSVLQKSGGGTIAAAGQPTSGQRMVVPATTNRIITLTSGANGSSTPVTKNFIVSTVPRTDASQNQTQHILVTPQGAKTVPRGVLVAQNGPSTSSTVTSMGGQVVLASVTPQQVRTVATHQLLQTASGVPKVVINQGNGRVLQVRQQTPSNSATGNGALTSPTVRLASPGLQTRFIHSQPVRSPQTVHTAAALPLPEQTRVIQPSADQLKPVSHSRTTSQVVFSQSSLSGAKVISASAAPSPGPSTGTLHHSFSMPVLSKEGSRSRSNSPVCGVGNIPTVVSQKVNVRNFPGASNDGREVSWASEDMHSRAFHYASLTQKNEMMKTLSPEMLQYVLENNPLKELNKRKKELPTTGEAQQKIRKTLQRQKNVQQIADDAEEEADELGHAETYADYKPKKLMFGRSHPDQVVESSSLSSVESPDVHYHLSIPEEAMDQGFLSALQLEAIIYTCQRHEFILPCGERAGYLIGDGAGVGKGRTVAGIIYENFLHGRKKAIWLSVSNDLKVDAERDLRDIGADNINVYLLSKFKYMAKLSSSENGSVKKGVVFGTYSSLIGESNQTSGKYNTRMKQLRRWCGKDFDGVIIFDECHKAKNLCPTGSSKATKTGLAVLELQSHLPKARVVYASATGATEPRNMAYMTRLGLWGEGTSFKEFNDFINSVEKRGVGAMELVAMDMKLRGMYIARQLSFAGTSFHVEEIPLTKDFHKIYNQAVEVWMEARSMFQKAAELIDADKRMQKAMWGQFWSAHQRFFKYLCISAKVKHCIKLAKDAVNAGKCVVIGLQSTGEARTQEMVEREGDELSDFVSTAKGVFQALVEKHFPAADRKKTFNLLGLERTPKNGGMNSGFKRKREDEDMEQNKRSRAEEDSNEDNSDVSDYSELSDSDSSSTNSDEDTNPFGSGNDSEEDPWVKKSKKKKKKKGKASKQKKKKGKKKKKEMNSDAEVDEYCDRKLAQMKKNNARLGCDDGSGYNDDLDDQKGMNHALEMKMELLNQVELLGESLPSNTLDVLIDGLGGTGKVAEMTGRKSRLVQNEGFVQYETRSETQVAMESLNLVEKERFMEGIKPIAIISDAASSGISLHADRRVENTARRVHITLELPWSADRAIQQFGRTHRSNQKNAPEYIFLISDLAGERRFASTVAKRLESLGALTHGDRRATESRDLSRFNIDNRYGRMALEVVLKSVLGQAEPFVDPPTGYTKEQFFEEAKKALEGVGLAIVDKTSGILIPEKEHGNISRFLNRLLGMPTGLQNALFDYFNNTLNAIILDAKRSGRWDMGILDLGSGEEVIQRLDTQVFVGNTATNTAKTELSTIQVERGMPWEKAMDIWRKCKTMEEGFYLSVQERTFKRTATLVAHQGHNKKKEKVYSLYRPNTGMQSRAETLEEIKKKYKKVMPDDAEVWWKDQYDASTTICTHAYWNGNCKKVASGQACEIGLRTRQYHMLSGSVLSVWGLVESVLSSMPGGNMSKMQIVRLRIGDGKKRDEKIKDDNDKKIVGSLIPSNCVPPLVHVLKNASARSYVETHNQTLQAAINGLHNSAIASTSSRFNGSLRDNNPRMETDGSLPEEPSGSSAAPPPPLLSMPTLID